MLFAPFLVGGVTTDHVAAPSGFRAYEEATPSAGHTALSMTTTAAFSGHTVSPAAARSLRHEKVAQTRGMKGSEQAEEGYEL